MRNEAPKYPLKNPRSHLPQNFTPQHMDTMTYHSQLSTRPARSSVAVIAARLPLRPQRFPRPLSAEKLTGSDRWTGKNNTPIHPGDSFIIRPHFQSSAMRQLEHGAWDDAALATKHNVTRSASDPLPSVSPASKHAHVGSIPSHLIRRVSTSSQHPGASSTGSLTISESNESCYKRHDALFARTDSVASSSSTRRNSLVSIALTAFHPSLPASPTTLSSLLLADASEPKRFPSLRSSPSPPPPPVCSTRRRHAGAHLKIRSF